MSKYCFLKDPHVDVERIWIRSRCTYNLKMWKMMMILSLILIISFGLLNAEELSLHQLHDLNNYNFTKHFEDEQKNPHISVRFDEISCTYSVTNSQTGEVFDYYLGYLAQGADLIYTDNANAVAYYVQICATTKYKCNEQSPVCQQDLAGSLSYSLGSLTTQMFGSSPFGVDKGVVVRYFNGIICGNGARSVTISLECDETYQGKGIIFSVVEAPTCSFIMQIASPYACPGLKPPSVTVLGLDIGWIIIICAAAVFVLYIVGGIVYKTKLASEKVNFPSVEMFPNIEFWKDLPVLVKDGSVFTYNKIMTLMGKEGSYNRL